MKNILILGTGAVAQFILEDLKKDYSVVAVTGRMFETDYDDLLRSDWDLIISTLPGKVGYVPFEKFIQAGKNIISTSYFLEYPDPIRLNDDAIAENVLAVYDMGLSPGLSNLISGYHKIGKKHDLYSIYITMGTFLNNPLSPFLPKITTCIEDFINRYTTPAYCNYEGEAYRSNPFTLIGKSDLVSENSNSLWNYMTDIRSLRHTLPSVPNLYSRIITPAEFLSVVSHLYFSGMLDDTSSPKLSRLYSFDSFKNTRNLIEDEAETVAFETTVSIDTGQHICSTIYTLEHKEIGKSALAFAAAKCCVSISRLFLNGYIQETGLIPPEQLFINPKGSTVDDRFEYVLEYLKDSGLEVKQREVAIDKIEIDEDMSNFDNETLH